MVENKKEVESVSENSVVVVGRGGLMKRTLKELEMLEVNLNDVFSIKGVSINLTWEKVIRLVNYNANKKVISWGHTFEEAMELINIFLL